MRGINCELVRKYAKDKVWEGCYTTLDDQIYVFGKQLHRMSILADKVDVIITDSPVLLSMYYTKELTKEFKSLILSEFSSFNNMNYFINRKKAYITAGRMQTEDEAKVIDGVLCNLLAFNFIPFEHVDGSRKGLQTIVDNILGRLPV